MVCPVINATMDTGSYTEFGDDPFCGKDGMAYFFDQYAPKQEDRTNQYLSLDQASDYSGLPPTFILTSECDVLRDEGEAYAEKLKGAGVEVRSERFAHHFHNSMLFNKLYGSRVEGTFEKIGAFLAAAFDGKVEE